MGLFDRNEMEDELEYLDRERGERLDAGSLRFFPSFGR